MYEYGALLARLVERVRQALPRQVTDPQHPAHGAFLSDHLGLHPSADHTASAADLANAVLVYLAPESSLRADTDLRQRILAAIDFQRRWQRPSGLIDLTSINWESPPDTAFVVQLLAPAAEIAGRCEDVGEAARIHELLLAFIRDAVTGIVDHGFHTPNHRWVVCSALAQARQLDASVHVDGYLDRILAEGIDGNADGQFSERSTGVYDAVCDRSLRFMADCLDRPELLDHVRRNLTLVAQLLNPDGTVVTSVSTRQDRGSDPVPVTVADSFFDLAHRDGNGQWAAIADLLVATGDDAAAGPWLVQPFLTWPALRHAELSRAAALPPVDAYLPAAGLWRTRSGKQAALAARGIREPFSMTYGAVRLRSLKISGTCQRTTQFAAAEMEPIAGGVRLRHSGDTPRVPGYLLPLGRPVSESGYVDSLALREQWQTPALDQTLELVGVDGGFDLRLRTHGGMDRIPLQVELAFDGDGEWVTEDTLIGVGPGMTAFLLRGRGIFRRGDDAISVLGGSMAHSMWHMRASEPVRDAFRVLLTYATPTDARIQLRAGDWHPPTRGLLPAGQPPSSR